MKINKEASQILNIYNYGILYIFYNIWGHYNLFISSYPLINGFCQDYWHIGVDRDWRECQDRQLWVEIDRIQAESIKIVCHVKMKGKTGLIKLTLMENKPKYNI